MRKKTLIREPSLNRKAPCFCSDFKVVVQEVLLCIGAFRSGTGNISLALSSKTHESEWDFILMDSGHLIMYEVGVLKQVEFF